MLHRAALIFAVCAGWACGQIPVPDTPSGQTLRAWLDAFNSGERVRVEKFNQKFGSQPDADAIMDLHDRTGSLELLSIEKTDRTHIEFKVKQIANSRTATGELEVTDAVPAKVVKMNFLGLQDLGPGGAGKR